MESCNCKIMKINNDFQISWWYFIVCYQYKLQLLFKNKIQNYKSNKSKPISFIIYFSNFRIPQTLGINQDEKESDNDDVVYIQSTKDSINNNANEGSKAANNPFRFGTNTESNANDTQHSKTMTKSQISQDSTSITINTITDLLKQLQQLTDKEKEILKSREENVSDNSNKAENRKRSRPQLLMKKMKCIKLAPG